MIVAKGLADRRGERGKGTGGNRGSKYAISVQGILRRYLDRLFLLKVNEAPSFSLCSSFFHAAFLRTCELT